jgi:hypothetical protein
MRGSLVLCREYRRRMSAWWCRDTARTDQSQCDRTVGEGLFHGRKRPRGLTDRRMGRVVFTKDFPDIALVARRSSLHHKAKIRPHSSGLRRRVGCQCHGLEASDDGGRAREAQRCSNLMRRRFRSATYERIMALRQAGEAGREQDAVPERGVPTGPRGGMRIGLHGGTGSVVMSDLIYRHRAVVPAAAPEPEFGASLSALAQLDGPTAFQALWVQLMTACGARCGRSRRIVSQARGSTVLSLAVSGPPLRQLPDQPEPDHCGMVIESVGKPDPRPFHNGRTGWIDG